MKPRQIWDGEKLVTDRQHWHYLASHAYDGSRAERPELTGLICAVIDTVLAHTEDSKLAEDSLDIARKVIAFRITKRQRAREGKA